LRVLTDRPGA
jgi:hypothetical protein